MSVQLTSAQGRCCVGTIQRICIGAFLSGLGVLRCWGGEGKGKGRGRGGEGEGEGRGGEGRGGEGRGGGGGGGGEGSDWVELEGEGYMLYNAIFCCKVKTSKLSNSLPVPPISYPVDHTCTWPTSGGAQVECSHMV